MTVLVGASMLVGLAIRPSRVRAVDPSRLLAHDSGIWRIRGESNMRRWVVIHNLAEAKTSGVFHIEVLGREKGRPRWDVKRLCNHMAITTDALARSVFAPLEHGMVYPEAFDGAYAKWKRAAAAGQAKVCKTSVLACMPRACT